MLHNFKDVALRESAAVGSKEKFKLVLHYLLAFLKPKLAWVLISNFLVVAVFLLSFAAYARAVELMFQHRSDEPTVSEQERHLEANDVRLNNHDNKFDKIFDLINTKFDQLEEDRQQRKADSDKRYDDLRRDVTLIYGGIGTLTFLMGIGVVKLYQGDKSGGGSTQTLRLTKEDTKQLAYLLSNFRDARQQDVNTNERG